MYKVSLQFDDVPKSLNVKLRTHYFKLNAEMKYWHGLVWREVSGRLPKKPLEHCHISISRHFYRTLDFDGLVGSMKPVIDGLVHAKVISDDSWKVTGQWDCNQIFRPKKDGPLLEVQVVEAYLPHI